MDLSRSIEEMISSMKERKDFQQNVLKKWINTKSNQGYTAILFASYRGNIDTIRLLVENGADIYATNIQGLNVIHMASQGNQPSSIVYFKEKFNFDLMTLDGVGSTALHWACYTGSEDAFNFLLSYNADINCRDNEGLTPLHLAIISGKIEMKIERTRLIKKLLQNGADRTIQDNRGRNCQKLAIEKNKHAIAEMISQSSVKCNLCVVKPPLEKVEPNIYNILFFLIIHFVFETFILYEVLLPYYESSLLYRILTYLYVSLFTLIIWNHLYLVYSDPGFLKNTSKLSLLKLVEKNIKVHDYCPVCVVSIILILDS